MPITWSYEPAMSISNGAGTSYPTDMWLARKHDPSMEPMTSS